MNRLDVPQIEGPTIGQALFGGNFLADRYPLNGGSGIEDQIARLGVDGLRYPGGSLTERLFDIRNPDAARVTDDDGDARDFVPLSDFLAYADANDHAVTIVIPTRDNLSNRTDGAGDRFPAFDEGDLRDFVRDVATGIYGDADIAAFEIGNEYWGSGQMTAVEYGRLSSRMADIIDDELTAVSMETGTAVEIDVIVQAGTNNAYSNLSDDYAGQPVDDVIAALNDRFDMAFDIEDRGIVFYGGNINWRGVNDALVLHEYSEDERGAVDGVVTHFYSKESVSPGQRDFGLTQVQRAWGEEFPDIDIHVTEWNQSASDQRLKDDEDYGLVQAHEVLDAFESMVAAGVDQAHVWPLIQNTRNALAPDAADGGLSPTGELFAMMSDALPGKTMLDFAPDDPRTTEEQGAASDLHGFYGGGEMVFYIASNADDVRTVSYDLADMVSDGGTAAGRVLGVTNASDRASVDARPTIENLPEEAFYDAGRIVATLDAGEIMEVRITDFVPTDAFATVMNRIDTKDTAAPTPPAAPPPIEAEEVEDFPIPTVPAENLPDEEPEDVEADDTDDIFDSLGWLLLLLPVLALGGLG
ncbi:hypothetical protein [Jannaschia sp. 2305UL9-9]|uniref:hypothetical protein n=1 Tax=Jannaschia sp. 2305UL9-9 TaxID=3121638 RepID=UPI0035288AE4